jgi:F-type H+-transporting ATPase subunit delta
MASIATLRDLTEALTESAREEGKLDKITSDLEDFFHLLGGAADLKNILWSSTFEFGERKGIIDDLSSKRGYDKLTVNFLVLALELDKLKSLIQSEETVLRKLRKASGRIRAEIITASEPSEAEIGRIKGALEKVAGGSIDITTKVDPSIVGGIVAKVEDRVFDGSIKTQLERIRGVLTRS